METENKFNTENQINAEGNAASHMGGNMNNETENTAHNQADAATENRAEPRLHLMRQFMQVGWLLNRFGEQRRSKYGPMGDPYRGQGRILALLKLQPGISQADLAYLLGMRPQSAGELLAKLERAGYVLRTPSADDKRVLHVQLTEEGVKAAEQRVKGESAFAVLTEEEKSTLSELLAKVAAGLEAEVGPAPEGPMGGLGRGWNRGGFGGGRPDPREMRRGRGGEGRERGPDAPREGRGGPRRGRPNMGPEGEMYFKPFRRNRRWMWAWMQGEFGKA